MDNAYFPEGRTVRRDRFAFIAAALLGVAAAFMSLFLRIAAVSGVFGQDIADLSSLFVIAGAVSAAGALGMSVTVMAARGGKIPSSFMFIGAGLICAGCLLDAVFSVMRRGSFHMSVQTLYFVMAIALLLTLAAALYSERGVLKALIASSALSVVALIAAFIPLFTGNAVWQDVLYALPAPLSFGVTALVCAGFLGENDGKD